MSNIEPPIGGAPPQGQEPPSGTPTGPPGAPQPPTLPPAPGAPTGGTPNPPAPPVTGEPPQQPQADPWTDPTAARAEIEKLRQENASWRTKVRDLEPLAVAGREAQVANQTDRERLETVTVERDTATTSLAQINAAMAAAPEGTPLATVQSLAGRIQGSTPEEMAEDAKTLFATFVPAAPPAQPAAGQQVVVESLTPGALPATRQPSIPEALAAAEAAGNTDEVRRLKAAMLDHIPKPQ